MDIYKLIALEKDNRLKECDKLEKSNLNHLYNVRELINNVLINPLSFKELDLELIKNNISLNQIIYNKLNMYQAFFKSKYFTLTEEQLISLKEELDKIKDILDIKIKQKLSNNFDYIKLNLEIDELEYIETKLNKEDLNIDDFKELNSLIKKNFKIENAIELLGYLAVKVSRKYNKEELEKDNIEEIEITNLDINALDNLLKKYKYDLNDLEKIDKEILLEYGNLDNIKNILTILSENDIKIDIKKYSKKIISIFLFSTKKIVSNIIRNIKDDSNSKDINLDEIFLEYLNYPTLFIKGTKELLDLKPIFTIYISNQINGSYTNYTRNRTLFKGIGLDDLNTAISKCGSVFELPVEFLKNNINIFEQYGISKNIYLETLSSLKSKNARVVLDKFIELNCFDYLKDNFSNVSLKPNDNLFYQIKNARLKGFTNEDIYRFVKNGNIKKVLLKKSTLLDKMNKTKLDLGEYHSELENDYLDMDFNEDIVIDTRVFKNYYIIRLEDNYKKDDLSYDFNGIIISRNKVLRNYAIMLKHAKAGNINSLMYSITKDSLLTKDEYDMIGECLNYMYATGGLKK